MKSLPVVVVLLAIPRSPAHPESVRALVIARSLTLGVDAPRRAAGTTARRATLAAAVRVVDRVHGDASRRRPDPTPTIGAGFTDITILMPTIGQHPDRRHASLQN